MSRIAILGGGSWGTGLAVVFSSSRRQHDIRLWVRDSSLAESLEQERENKKYLPGVSIPACVKASTKLAEVLHEASWMLSHRLEWTHRAGISCSHVPVRVTPRAKSRAPKVGYRAADGCWKTRQRGRCPSYPRQESRCGSCGVTLGFSKGEFGFGAVRQALQVGVVFENYQRGCEKGAEVDHERRRVAGCP